MFQFTATDPASSSLTYDIKINGQDIVAAGGSFFAESRVRGDINGDGTVNFLDVGLFSESLQKVCGDVDFNPYADFKVDGVVNFLDYSFLVDNFLVEFANATPDQIVSIIEWTPPTSLIGQTVPVEITVTGGGDTGIRNFDVTIFDPTQANQWVQLGTRNSSLPHPPIQRTAAMTTFKQRAVFFVFALWAVCPPLAGAAIVTYEFTVTGGYGPLGDVVTQGHLSFDDSLQPLLPWQDYLLGDDLIADLSFTWNGVVYDETTANTGGFVFNESGEIVGVLFGNNCPVNPNGCSMDSLQDHWSILLGFQYLAGNIEYSHPSQPGFFFSDITARQVPLPSALLLLMSALGIFGFRQRKS